LRSHVFPILDILSRSGDIVDQSRKLCKIAPNFARFWPPKFCRGQPPKFLDWDYKAHPDVDHVLKFHGDRLSELGDLVAN